MRKFVVPDHSRAGSTFTTTSQATSNVNSPNPFATPPASIFGANSGYQYSESAGSKYFRSRRIRKDDAGHEPPTFKKDPKEKWLCIIPMLGLFTGIAITGVMIYLKIGRLATYNYCPVLDDDFSSGVLNKNIWQAENEVGGYGCVIRSTSLKYPC